MKIWQKAKVLKASKNPDAPPVGFEFWVTGEPTVRSGTFYSLDLKRPITSARVVRGLQSNILNPATGRFVWINLTAIELISEFLVDKDPSFLNWGDWLPWHNGVRSGGASNDN